MFAFRKYAAIAVSLGTLTLVGCLGGGGDDKKTDVSVGEATAAATGSLATSINAAYNAINAVASDSTAVNVVLARGMVSVPASAKLKEQVLSRARSLAKSPLGSRMASRAGDIRAAAQTELVTDDTLAQFLGTATVDGNTVTYTLNADTICANTDDYYTPENEETECREFMARISVVQTVVDSDTGTLTFKIDAAAPIVIGYDPSSIYLEVDLAQIKAAAVAMNPTATDDFSSTFAGAIRLTLAINNATAGAESVAITLGVTTAIDIVGTGTDGDYSLQIAASDDLFEVSADAGAGTATVSVDVGEVHFEFPSEDDITLAITPALFHLGGLTGSLTLGDAGSLLTGTNVGITEELYYDSDTGNGSVKEELVTLPAFDFEIHGGSVDVDPEIHVETALNFYYEIGTASEVGSYSFAVELGTEIMQMVDMNGNEVFMVMMGSVNATGEGIFGDGGPINATASMNSCFDDDDYVTTEFPLVAVDCPM